MVRYLVREVIPQGTGRPTRDAAFLAGNTLHSETGSARVSATRYAGSSVPEIDDEKVRSVIEGHRAAMNRLSPKERATVLAAIGYSGSLGWETNGAGISTKSADNLLDPDKSARKFAEMPRGSTNDQANQIAGINKANADFWATRQYRPGVTARPAHTGDAAPKTPTSMRDVIAGMNRRNREMWNR